MRAVNKLVWKLVPGLALEIRRARRFTAALAADRELHATRDLRPELLKSLVTLPDRASLLRHLPTGGAVAEIGVCGDFAEQILTINKPARLHLIDRWHYPDMLHGVRKRFAEQIAQGMVELHHAKSGHILPTFPDRYFSWVYIDAGQDFGSVQDAIALAYPKIMPGGYIVGHNYDRWEVTSDGLTRYGVIEAVNQFCNQTSAALSFLTCEAQRSFAFKV